MKMCSISVEPMPSIISMPVASFHSLRVAAGSASPADTHFVSDDRSWFFASAAIARYDVGAVNRTVARCFAIAGSRNSGAGRSTSSVAAPIDSGKSRSPPNPNVNASGGLPVNRSSGEALSVERGKQAQAATTSRWKCIVPFGLPVVPDVNAMSAVSSAAVSTLAKVGGLRRGARVEPLRLAGAEQQPPSRASGKSGRAASSSSARRASQSACETCALVMTSVSSFARSSGIVPTAMPPAFITANQQAACSGLFGRPQQHAIAGDETEILDQHAGDPVRVRQEVGIGPAQSVRRHDRGPLAPAALDRAIEQRRRAVQALRILQLRQLEDELGPLLPRRQVVPGERVEMRRVSHRLLPFQRRRISRATISFCTSVAPS